MKRAISYTAVLMLALLTVAVGQILEKPFPFIVVGDTGCDCDGQEEVAERLLQWYADKPFQHVLMLGDNVYGQASILGGDRRLFEDRFDDYYEPLLNKGVKFFAVLGNHDVETRDGRDEIQDKKRFNILSSKGYYKFDSPVKEDGQPLITFFAVNSVGLETKKEKRVDNEQLTWLSRALADSTALWKIPFYHHPMYTPGGAHEGSPFFLQRVESVFVAAGVQATFAGHNHFYARMKPQKDIVHFVSGGGGRALKTPEKDPKAEIARESYHFMYIEVTADKLEFWTIPALGDPIDHGVITRRVAE